jgi:hypothetical protein
VPDDVLQVRRLPLTARLTAIKPDAAQQVPGQRMQHQPQHMGADAAGTAGALLGSLLGASQHILQQHRQKK